MKDIWRYQRIERDPRSQIPVVICCNVQVLDPPSNGGSPHSGRLQPQIWRPPGHRHNIMQLCESWPHQMLLELFLSYTSSVHVQTKRLLSCIRQRCGLCLRAC